MHAAVTALALLGGAGPAHAQGWAADLYAGRALHETVSANVPATSLVAGVRRGSARASWLYAAAAAPLDVATPAWAAAGGVARFPLRPVPAPFSSALDLGAHGYGFRDGAAGVTGSGVTLEGGATLAARVGPLLAEARGGWRQHVSSIDGDSRSRGALDGALRGETMGAVRAGAELRWVRTSDDVFPAAAADVAASIGRVGVALGVERWLGDALDDLGWSASAILPAGAVDVWASLRQETPDPLYGNSPRRSWNVGVTRRFGARPTPAAVAPVRDGRAVIRLPRTDAAGGASVAGDFTGWQPRAMTANGDHWELLLALPPGVYRYAFVDAAGTWFVPASVPGRMDDGMGGHTAVLIVQ